MQEIQVTLKISKILKEKLGKPDLSLIPIGAYAPQWFMKANHVNPEEALQVALDLGSKKITPCIGERSNLLMKKHWSHQLYLKKP